MKKIQEKIDQGRHRITFRSYWKISWIVSTRMKRDQEFDKCSTYSRSLRDSQYPMIGSRVVTTKNRSRSERIEDRNSPVLLSGKEWRPLQLAKQNFRSDLFHVLYAILYMIQRAIVTTIDTRNYLFAGLDKLDGGSMKFPG